MGLYLQQFGYVQRNTSELQFKFWKQNKTHKEYFKNDVKKYHSLKNRHCLKLPKI